MITLSIANICILIIYGLLFSIVGWGLLKSKKEDSNDELIPLSVIIPFRNEENNIEALVKSFNRLNYNLNIVEFIFVDDHSNDDSISVLQNALNSTNLIYKIIKQSANFSGKKNALHVGIENAKNEYIITTDADTVHNKFWLSAYSIAFKNNTDFVIGPVINKKAYSFIPQLHNLEALMLSGVTIGSANVNKPLLCSGANLGYTKTLYNTINPYKNNINIPSGDDLFFLDQIINTDYKIETLKGKEALVFTQPSANYFEILKQAIRWSSKNKYLSNKSNLYSSILVFITNILVYINIFALLNNNNSSLLFLIGKFIIDINFLIILIFKYNQKYLIFNAPFIYILYPIHLMIIFVSSFFIKVKWKGRMISANG